MSDGKIILFTGPETFRLREHTAQYYKAAREKYGEWNTIKVDAAETAVEELKMHFFSLPFLGDGKKIIFLDAFPLGGKNEAEKEKNEQVLELLKKIPTEVVVICSAENPDRRTKVWKDLQKISDAAASQDFAPLKDQELTEWIRKSIAKYGAKILPSAAEFLWQYAGSNLWKLHQEILKLAAYQEEKPISERDISEICDPSQETIQFALSNAFASGKETEVLRTLSDLLRSGESPFSLLFRDFGSTLRTLLLTNFALQHNLSAQAIGVHPFAFGKMKATAGKISFSHLKNMHQKLLEIDEGTKNGTIPSTGGREDLLIFALENWIREFFSTPAAKK